MKLHPTAERILEVSVGLIDEHGEAGLRIQDVQCVADVTAPSIYHFYGSREGLVSAAQMARLRRSFDANDALLDAAMAGVSSKQELRAALTTFLSLFFDESRVDARRQRMASLGSSEGRPELAAMIAAVIDEYVTERTERLLPFQERGWIEADLDLRVFNYWVLGVVFGRVYVEFGGEPSLCNAWDLLSERALTYLMFGPD